MNDLAFARNGAKLLFELKQGVRDHFIRDRLAIIEPQGQENLEAAQGSAHK
jgi:hypothetical protein